MERDRASIAIREVLSMNNCLQFAAKLIYLYEFSQNEDKKTQKRNDL